MLSGLGKTLCDRLLGWIMWSVLKTVEQENVLYEESNQWFLLRGWKEGF